MPWSDDISYYSEPDIEHANGVMYHIIVNQTLGMPWSDVSYYSEPDIGHAME